MEQKLRILIVDAEGDIVADSGESEGMAALVLERVYVPGDKIVVESSMVPAALRLHFDDAVKEGNVYLTTSRLEYPIPLGMEHDAYPPEAFMDKKHRIEAEYISGEKWNTYKNVSENPLDRRGDTTYYPHCTANAETRGESVFAARNVIDGSLANTFHGEWPYTSWGEDERKDAEIMIEFGRTVRINETKILIRADFPHDNYWTQCRIVFSDGSDMVFSMEKTGEMQSCTFEPKNVTWIKLKDFVRSDEPSPFPALSEWEVFGWEV